MAHAGDVGPELADLLRFAADLMDIIAEALQDTRAPTRHWRRSRHSGAC
jgi:hypothetical protein